MAKDFDDFERYVRSDAFKAEEARLLDAMFERFDRLAADPANGLNPRDRDVVPELWAERQRPLLMLRKYHEWLNS